MVVDAHTELLALRDVRAEVLDLVGKHVAGSVLDRGRQVHNHGLLHGRLPRVPHGVADLDGELGRGVGERLGAELELPVCACLLGVVLREGPHELGALHGELEGVLLRVVEDDPPEALAGGKVDVDDGVLSPLDRLDGTLDEIRTARGEDLDRNVVGDRSGGLDEASREVEVGFRGRREGNFDLLEANLAQHLEEAPLLVSVLLFVSVSAVPPGSPAEGLTHHWRWIALVSIAKTGFKPPRGLCDFFRGPLAVGEVEGGEALVLLPRFFEPAF